MAKDRSGKAQSDGLKQAQASVKFAQAKQIIDAVPFLGIGERILKQAKALVPAGIPVEYRKFLEAQFALIAIGPDSYENFQVVFQKVEDDIWGALGNKATERRRKKVSAFLSEKGPLKLLAELWLPLAELRYEYFTSSALKILQRAKLFRKNSPIFANSPILNMAFLYAIARDDLDFFARVGDVLRKRQEDLGSLVSDLLGNKLQRFLLAHWADEVDGVPRLYVMSLSQLTECCNKHLGINSLTEDAVDKTKQRLGLKSSRSKSRR